MRTLVLLMTDIVGSTSLWASGHEAMSVAVSRHREIAHGLIELHGGTRPVYQGEGDSIFAAFETASAAASCAVDIQRGLLEEDWPTGQPLAVRIGVHVGAVEERDGNLFGETVNRCARIRSVGHGGQILLSTATCELVRHCLPVGASLRNLGAHRLKDLVHPEGVWQLDHPDLFADFPALTSLNRGRHNLPLQLTSFVGREAEVGELTERLRGEARLVTITGFGGIGKTRLALAVAAVLVDGTGDGVWFVDLAGVADPELVPREIATQLGVRDIGEGMGPAVLEHLRGRRLLLVLDNLEQILGCAEFVAHLLTEAPDVKILATSRNPLALRGEVVYALQPFPTSTQPTRTGDVQSMPTSAAVALFIDRARDARRDFGLTEDNAAAVAAVCARLDGVPLAIELAAARVSMLTPELLLTRLELSFGVLSASELDRPERHRTVRATVAWSYDLLTADEKLLLSRLSVFPGSVGLDAVEAVCAEAPPAGLPQVFPLLASLVDKSLVRRSEQDGEPRFSLLVWVRQFGEEQLSDAARAALADLHLAHYLRRSVAGTATADGPDEQPWYDEMHRDAHNFRAALDHAERTGRSYEHLLLAANLADFWDLGGHGVEGFGQILRAQAAAQVDDLQLVAYAKGVEARLDFVDDVASSASLAWRSVELAEQSGDLPVMAHAYQLLGYMVPDRLAAREANEHAVALARAARDQHSQIRWGTTRPDAVEIGASSWLMRFHRWSDPALAWTFARTLRQRADTASREGDVAYLDYWMGELASDVGDVATAVPLFDQAAEAFTRRRDHPYVAHAALGKTRAQVRSGQESAESLVLLIKDCRDVAFANHLAAAEVLLGDLHAVARKLSDADAAYRRAAASHLDRVQPTWRLLRLARLNGVDTCTELEEVYGSWRANWRWALPDLLGCLVEAAVTAECFDQPERAAALTATVTRLRGSFLLPEVILEDLKALVQTYVDETDADDLPYTLFGQ